jgi:hypothetical protein
VLTPGISKEEIHKVANLPACANPCRATSDEAGDSACFLVNGYPKGKAQITTHLQRCVDQSSSAGGARISCYERQRTRPKVGSVSPKSRALHIGIGSSPTKLWK